VKFNKLTPNLMVEDVARTLDYYLDVLGFEFVMGVAQGSRQAVMSYTRAVTLDFAIMRRDGVELMFQRRGSPSLERSKNIGITSFSNWL